MKTCPECRERFEEDLNFCTYDGATLTGGRGPAETPARFRGLNGWKVAFWVQTVVMLAAVGGAAFYLMDSQPTPPSRVEEAAPPAETGMPGLEAVAVEARGEQYGPVSIGELSRAEVLGLLPGNLLRRFHAGGQEQGRPEDFRVVAGDGGEYVILVGAGRLENKSRAPIERVMVLKREGEEFTDVTRLSMPQKYASGIVGGRHSTVRFNDQSLSLVVREPASSPSIVEECDTCERAYQIATLEWKAGRYLERDRRWENSSYTAFYVLAEALDRKRVEDLSRPFIDPSLDSRISSGFGRTGKRGWLVRWLIEETGSDEAACELMNGQDLLRISLSRVNDQWTVTRIASPEVTPL